MRPSLNEEKKLWKKGFKKAAGLDEAGRGPLAGPVIACVIVLDRAKLNLRGRLSLTHIRDSKKLTPKKREEFYKLITKNPAIEWGTGRVSEKVIDRINILEATKLAMKKAIQKLNKKPNFLILDGRMALDLKIPQKSIVKADEKVFSCALASIIAKVTRDRLMARYHQQYPGYLFDKHMGYPTKFHRKMLKKYGPCPIHRKSFKPIKAAAGLAF